MSRVCTLAAGLLALAIPCSSQGQVPFEVPPPSGPSPNAPALFAPQPIAPEPVAPPSANTAPFTDHGVPYIKDAQSGPYLDLDEYRMEEASPDAGASFSPWTWQSLPAGLVYAPYLADTKASRFSTTFIDVKGDGWLWDATLGTQVALLRYGSLDRYLPEGFEIGAEGSAQLRLDLPENIDVRSVDFRGGVPITFGSGARRWKVGYYHISSHLGDEFLLNNPGFPRLNFVRDVLIFGYSRYFTPQLRSYVELGWGFHTDVSEPWELQFGLDYAPVGPTGPHGAPFFALNARVREELDYSGPFTFQLGWAWRSCVNATLLRAGLHYYNGKSSQYSFYTQNEQQIGVGLWYDF